MNKLLSIVMPCHNRREALRRTLESLNEQTCSSNKFELLIVDQASTDGSREFIRSFGCSFQLRLIEQEAMYGPSVARNEGVAFASSNLILFLDADIIADPGMVKAHLDFYQKNPQTIICGRVMPYPPAYSTYIEFVADPESGLDRGQEVRCLAFYDAVGGNMLLSKELFFRIGPLNLELKAFEDIDFAYRASLLGIPILNNATAISYHNHPRTLSQRFEQAYSYARTLPVLLEHYQELKFPLLNYCESIQWRQDGLKLIANKLIARIFGFFIIRLILIVVLQICNLYRCLPRMVRFLYWKLLIGNWYRGYHDGLLALKQSKG
jgi:glycosyltransferase involved in cell wall biosynthesis